MARDIFIDGNSFQSSRHVDKEKNVSDPSFGVGFTYGRWKYSYTKVFRTREFAQQPHSHEYGSVTISYSW